MRSEMLLPSSLIRTHPPPTLKMGDYSQLVAMWIMAGRRRRDVTASRHMFTAIDPVADDVTKTGSSASVVNRLRYAEWDIRGWRRDAFRTRSQTKQGHLRMEMFHLIDSTRFGTGKRPTGETAQEPAPLSAQWNQTPRQTRVKPYKSPIPLWFQCYANQNIHRSQYQCF